MPDEDLRELERRWAEGQGDLAAGEAFSRALERAGADTGRRLEVRLQGLRAHMRSAGLGHLTVSPQPELDPMAASFLIPGEEAFRAWHALRTRTEASGAYPVIVGAEHEVELMLEAINLRPDLTPAAILASADGRPPPPPVTEENMLQRWPTDLRPSDELTVILDPATGQERAVRIALLPTRTPWHAAAYVRLGVRPSGLGDGPELRDPAAHVALHRSWFERFSALPLGLALGVVELFVDRPPRSRDERERLWGEHALYAATPALHAGRDGYVARLLGATIWTLWC